MTTKKSNVIKGSFQRKAIPIDLTRVLGIAQREVSPGHVRRIAEAFDADKLGTITVNARDGVFYIMDGQHRVAAAKEAGYEDAMIDAHVYTDLTDEQMAETFLVLNANLPVSKMDKFQNQVTANYDAAVSIQRIAKSVGYKIRSGSGDGVIQCVAPLERIYASGGSAALWSTLTTIRDAYGDSGMKAPLIQGIGQVCAIYSQIIDHERLTERLSSARGGMNGLLGAAQAAKLNYDIPLATAVSVAVVDLYNKGRGGKKLPNWAI
ncbi:DUF6551 family protein [Tsukamurella paurometabola]|uniref:Uncharacterized protein n=1 Tax=Tsukamurella paurometabola TaxID=2061 RepID=A0ABS5NDX6_TSUPA|nr:DUF6551 family protein [Tsukamurella paurometabola]MBS4102465.1 hypothetical protein [Tsukamurella paurometabola]